MVKQENKQELYMMALEEELCASLEREKKLSEEDLSFSAFIIKKIKRSRFYKNVFSNPNSKMGKAVRAPRSFYRIIKNPEVRKNLVQKKTVNSEKYLKSEYLLNPWLVSLEERKKTATQAIEEGRKVVIYFVEKPDSSTFRYRCYNTFLATKNSKKWQAVYFFKNEVKTVEELLPNSNELVFGRQSGQEKLVNRLTKMAHKNGLKVGLDIDDLVFDMKYINVVLDTIGEKINRSYWVAYFASVQSMAKQMDFFITTNEYLVKKLKGSFKKPCKVIRNSLNQEQINASLVYIEQSKKRNDKNFRVGYFSGSPTHAKDFAVAESELIKFLDKHDEAILNVVGYMRFSKGAEKLLKSGRINFLPFTDFRKLQRLMAEVDVNIAPLVINEFTNCKSELKFFEAAAVETTTIASPTYTFKKAIADGENGFLAYPGQWYEKLEYLYNNPKENHKIALKAKKFALKHYYGKEFLEEVETAYDYFAK